MIWQKCTFVALHSYYIVVKVLLCSYYRNLFACWDVQSVSKGKHSFSAENLKIVLFPLTPGSVCIHRGRAAAGRRP